MSAQTEMQRRSDGLRIGSLFSGIGGLELGLERAGLGPVVWQCEIDAAARKCLRRHWPGVTQHNDVREVRNETAEQVDIICGGFPCQDLSFAGKGAGLSGTRSGLWFEYFRVVRALRPRFVVVENVPALLVRGLDVVLGGLAEAGYDAVWFTLRAADVGATHRRERVFAVAYRNGKGQSQPEGAEPDERGWAGDGGGDVGHADCCDDAGRQSDSERKAEKRATAKRSSQGVGHSDGAGLEGRSVRRCGRADERAIGAAGSEVVYPNDRGCGETGRSRDGGEVGAGRGNSDLPSAIENAGTLAHEFPPGPGDHDGWREYLSRFPSRAPAVPNTKGTPSLNPAFVEALMGFPEGWTQGTRSERLKQLGNAVVPQCAEVVGHVLLGLARQTAGVAS